MQRTAIDPATASGLDPLNRVREYNNTSPQANSDRAGPHLPAITVGPYGDRMTTRSGPIAASVAVFALLTGCSPTGPITPTVTSAGVDPNLPGYLSATGSVSGVAEDGGKCIFTFWADSGAATRLSGPGTSDGVRTACGPVTEALGFLVGGSYEVELRYESISGESVASERVPMLLPRPTNLNP